MNQRSFYNFLLTLKGRNEHYRGAEVGEHGAGAWSLAHHRNQVWRAAKGIAVQWRFVQAVDLRASAQQGHSYFIMPVLACHVKARAPHWKLFHNVGVSARLKKSFHHDDPSMVSGAPERSHSVVRGFLVHVSPCLEEQM